MIDLFTLISIHFLTIYTISKYVFPFIQPLMVRVLAAGKPGTIAFIGATRFAPGQWFGVILDAPDGAIMGKCLEDDILTADRGTGYLFEGTG